MFENNKFAGYTFNLTVRKTAVTYLMELRTGHDYVSYFRVLSQLQWL